MRGNLSYCVLTPLPPKLGLYCYSAMLRTSLSAVRTLACGGVVDMAEFSTRPSPSLSFDCLSMQYRHRIFASSPTCTERVITTSVVRLMTNRQDGTITAISRSLRVFFRSKRATTKNELFWKTKRCVFFFFFVPTNLLRKFIYGCVYLIWITARFIVIFLYPARFTLYRYIWWGSCNRRFHHPLCCMLYWFQYIMNENWSEVDYWQGECTYLYSFLYGNAFTEDRFLLFQNNILRAFLYTPLYIVSNTLQTDFAQFVQNKR